MTQDQFLAKLVELRACPPACRFCYRAGSPERSWNTCPIGSWMFWWVCVSGQKKLVAEIYHECLKDISVTSSGSPMEYQLHTINMALLGYLKGTQELNLDNIEDCAHSLIRYEEEKNNARVAVGAALAMISEFDLLKVRSMDASIYSIFRLVHPERQQARYADFIRKIIPKFPVPNSREG